MADFNSTPIDTISIDTAGELDANWMNAGMPADGLRIVSNKRHTLLTVPSLNGSAPTYQFSQHNPATGVYGQAYYHVAGPTLADWQAERDYADLRDTQRMAF